MMFVISPIPATGIRQSTSWIFPCSAGGSGTGISPCAGMPIGGHLNGEVLSWYGFPSLVTYQRSPAMTPTPVAVPV